MANVFMSLLTSGKFSIKVDPSTVVTAAGQAARGLLLLRRNADDYVPNPCSFYLLNLAIDTTLGIPILIVIVRVTTKLASYTPFGKPLESIQSGHYGSPPSVWWWLKQSMIYFCGLMGMKLCVLIIFMMFPWISHVGDWALGWTEGNERLQIVFVMMLFPLIMNAMQYYIIDSYIKEQDGSGVREDEHFHDGGVEGGRSAASSDTASARYEVISAVDDDSTTIDSDGGTGGDYDDDDAAAAAAAGQRRTRRGRGLKMQRKASSRESSKGREYDPTTDGESQTIVGSSVSRASQASNGLVPKELIPPE